MKLTSSAMWIVAAAGWLIAGADAQSRPAQRRITYQKIEFRGEVKGGDDFRRPFGPGLVFWLSANQQGTGWTVEICEGTETSCGNDYVWLVSPPYRSYNDRYLDTSYGVPAADAVTRTPREFRFVVSKEDFERAKWLYDKLDQSRPDQERPLNEAEHEHYHNDRERLVAHAGRGKLWITGSTIRDGKIESLKFRVRLEVPPTRVAARTGAAWRPTIVDKPIVFDQERKDLTLAYRRQHSDPRAKDIVIAPQMVILHWTAINSFDAAWKYFNNVRAESARTALAHAGDVNVSTHFLVDRDGTIYRLMPETWMARHCIGLNHVAIGIENVGDGDKFPLTEAQVEANAQLVRYLTTKYPKIQYLIGHSEYRKFEGTPLFVERDPKYRNQKPDPGPAFMEKVREKVKDLGLSRPPLGMVYQ